MLKRGPKWVFFFLFYRNSQQIQYIYFNMHEKRLK